MQISNILAKKGSDVATIGPDQTIREALALLVGKRIGALVVVDEAGKVVGLLSERDIIREAAQNEALFSQLVGHIMTKDVIVARPGDDLHAVEQTMTVKRFRHLPIMDHGELIGIVSIGDVVKAALDESEGVIETLESRVEKG
ncbi:MAG: CBS domain-containing protein [Thermoflexales bacterium]|nr:CBS domain-containing protein [Thermoflexales bacterium]